MKTSNKLIIGLFTFIFLAVAGSVFTLKAQYDKIDKNDPFLGYKRHIVKPFKFIKLNGYPYGYVQIQSGKAFEVMLRDHYYFNIDMADAWKIKGDTLVIEDDRKIPGNNTQVFSESPLLYVTAPSLLGIHAVGSPSKVSGWPGGKIAIDLEKSRMILTGNSFDKLLIDAHSGSYVEIGDGNKFDLTNIQVKDSSRFEAADKYNTTIFGPDSTYVFREKAAKPDNKNTRVSIYGIDSIHIRNKISKPTVKSVSTPKK